MIYIISSLREETRIDFYVCRFFYKSINMPIKRPNQLTVKLKSAVWMNQSLICDRVAFRDSRGDNTPTPQPQSLGPKVVARVTQLPQVSYCVKTETILRKIFFSYVIARKHDLTSCYTEQLWVSNQEVSGCSHLFACSGAAILNVPSELRATVG